MWHPDSRCATKQAVPAALVERDTNTGARPRPRRTVSVLLVLLLLGLGTAAAQDAGEFTATIGGGDEEGTEISGFAKSFRSAEKKFWYVQLIVPGGASTIMLMYSGAAQPSVGEHDIVDWLANDAEPPEGKLVATGSVDPQLFAVTGFSSISGKLDVTEASEDAVKASFEFSARDGSGATVRVSGSFTSSDEENVSVP